MVGHAKNLQFFSYKYSQPQIFHHSGKNRKLQIFQAPLPSPLTQNVAADFTPELSIQQYEPTKHYLYVPSPQKRAHNPHTCNI